MLQGQLSGAERRELRWLEEQASPSGTLATVDHHLPGIGRDLFEECRRAIAVGVPRSERVATGARLERALLPFARRTAAADVSLKSVRRVYWLGRRYVRPRGRRKTLATGGSIVAIEGGSAPDQPQRLVEALDRWLRKDVAVLPVSYGQPVERASRRALRFAAMGGLVLSADHPASAGDDAGAPGPGREVPTPSPDLRIVVLPTSTEHPPLRTSERTVHVLDGGDEAATFHAVQRALWTWL
jgi:hypothetical protein